MTNREMEYGKNETFTIFNYTFPINWVATGAQIVPIEYTLCFICYFDLFGSVFNKIILYATTPYFQ